MIEAPPTAKVGSKHRVTWVRLKPQAMWQFPKGCVLPVYGHEHEDAEIIGFPERHWHIDWRFVPAGTFEKIKELRLRQFRDDVPLSYLHAQPVSQKNIVGEPFARRATMLRRMPHHPSEEGPHIMGSQIAWLRPLEDKYEQQTAERHHRCRVCPHKGVKLGSIRDKAGNLVCPSHGLTWSPKDGTLIRRTDARQSLINKLESLS